MKKIKINEVKTLILIETAKWQQFNFNIYFLLWKKYRIDFIDSSF